MGRHVSGNPGTVKLPIAYSSALYVVVVTTNDNENVATTNAAYNYTNSGFDFRDNRTVSGLRELIGRILAAFNVASPHCIYFERMIKMPLNAKDARIFIKFNSNGTRDDTRIEGANLEIIPTENGEIYASAIYADGTYDELDLTNYIETSYADYMLYCGNSLDGKEYVRNMETGEPMEKPPYVPTQGEKNQEQANTAKSELRNLAINAMMATLAGGDITVQKTEYQSNIMALSDDVALLIPEVYPVWGSNSVEYKVNDRVQYNGVLYKVLTAHTSQETWKPDVAPSLFVKVISSISGEIPDWEQPSAGNAYMKGDKVRYNGKVYESLIDNNVWKPDEYPAGWKEVTETITIL